MKRILSISPGMMWPSCQLKPLVPKLQPALGTVDLAHPKQWLSCCITKTMVEHVFSHKNNTHTKTLEKT
jgi:hypothetical protein